MAAFDVLNTWPAADRIFLLSAVVGGLSFTIWLLLQFVGGLGEGAEAAADLNADPGGGNISGTADLSFTLLSFQGIASFLTMFGLVGLSARREADASPLVATLAASAGGLAMGWLIGRLFRFFRSLQSSGTLHPEAAVGQEGQVYLRIRPGNTGKVQLTVQGRLQVMEAVSEASTVLETGTRVKVVRMADGRTVVVVKI